MDDSIASRIIPNLEQELAPAQRAPRQQKDPNTYYSLPKRTQRQMHARHLSDLLPIGESSSWAGNAAIAEAGRDAQRFPAAAIAELEQVVADYRENADSAAQPLYCESTAARALLPYAQVPRERVYASAPLYLYSAHAGLADMYSLVGDCRRALSAADAAIALAPTETQAYLAKSFVFARLGSFGQASTVAKLGLEFAVDDAARAQALMHLSSFYLREGKRYEAASALACLAFAQRPWSCFARRQLGALKQSGDADALPLTVDDALFALEADGVPLRLAPEARDLLEQAGNDLARAGYDDLAEPCYKALLKGFVDKAYAA